MACSMATTRRLSAANAWRGLRTMTLPEYVQLCLVTGPIAHAGLYASIMSAVRKVGGIWFCRAGALRLSFCVAKGA